MHTDIQEIQGVVEKESAFVTKLTGQISSVIVGQKYLIDRLLVAILANGHILIEGVPGLAKTLSVKTLADAIQLSFRRLQFTPDLLPADLIGTMIYNPQKAEFTVKKGPVFANIILADEINRASPRTQSALLEAMQEYQVTLEGETMHLPQPFIVLATQNPIEYEGTFPLPEAQLDRFIMKLSVGYPTPKDEQEILRRRRERRSDTPQLQAVTDAEGLMAMRAAVEEVHVDTDIENYIVTVITETRRHRKVTVGSSPRGTLALLKLSRSWAAIHGRDYVLPDDVKIFILPALSHRLLLEPDLWTDRAAPNDVLAEIARSVPVPILRGA
jgi:MoxR-like ATPase